MLARQLELSDPARLTALRRLNLLDSKAEEAFDRITRMASRHLQAPVALVSLVDDHRQYFKAFVGLQGQVAEVRETPLSHSFCQHVVTSGAPLIVADAETTPLVCENLAIRDLGVKAYLGAPIISPDGFILGSFCVIDSKPRVWLQSEIALVEDFAGLVNTEVALRATLIEKTTDAARQRAVLDGTTFSVIATSPEGMIEMFNTGAERMLGYTSEEMVGKRTPACLHLQEEVVAKAAELSARLGRSIEPGFEAFVATARLNQAEESEWTYVRKDGTHVPVLLTVTALHDPAGLLVGFLGVAQDITLRKHLLKNLAEARDEALEASRKKSEFLATMSHEIRTPMNAVIGMAELLADTQLNREQTAMVRTMVGGAENLLTIINDILDFSRIEAGRLRLDNTDFNFQEVVHETVALLQPRAQAKGLALSCHFTSPLSTLVSGDRGRIRQILTNLVGNGIKFTEKGSVSVDVQTVSETADQYRIAVEVRDTGVGISQEAQSRLFQPFSQEDSSTTRRFGGTGLGLAICRQLLELMEGEISLESATGQGSTFRFELNLKRRALIETPAFCDPSRPSTEAPITCNTSATEPATRIVPTPATAAPFLQNPDFSGKGLRLLLAEDNLANQLVASILLQKLGFIVEIAGDGVHALEKLRTSRFDGILMDCQMPVLDGYEVTRRIRSGTIPRLNPNIPVIALTAYARIEDRAKCLRSGMSDYVTKPIRTAELTDALKRCQLVQLPDQNESPEIAREEDAEIFDEEFLSDAKDLLGASGGPLIVDLIRSYNRDERSWLLKIEQAANAQQADLVANDAHRFGGSASAFGAVEIRKRALELERAAREKDWPAVQTSLLRLRRASTRLHAEISKRGLDQSTVAK